MSPTLLLMLETKDKDMMLKTKDNEFITEVVNQLYIRHEINVNESGSVTFMSTDHEIEDTINPQVTISKDEIKSKTDRSKLRDVVMDAYIEKFNEHQCIFAEVMNGNSISVSFEPIRSKDMKFKSFSDLRSHNNIDIANEAMLEDD